MLVPPTARLSGDHPDLPAAQDRTHRLLAAGVPLSLLLDLAEPRGPRSQELFSTEEADDDSWLDALR